MLPRGRWIPLKGLGWSPPREQCGLLSLGSSSEMLSQRAGGCQILEARLTFAILEGAGTISISLGPGLRPKGSPVGAGEGAVTSRGGTSRDTSVPQNSALLPHCSSLALFCPHTQLWGLHHPSPPPSHPLTWQMQDTGSFRPGEGWPDEGWPDEHWAEFWSQLLPNLLYDPPE